MGLVGKWTFLVGLVIAVVAGLGFEQSWMAWVLVLLGVVAGVLNVTSEESRGFLLASIGLIVAADAANGLPYVGDLLGRVIANLVVFLGGAVLVVALKSVFKTARD